MTEPINTEGAIETSIVPAAGSLLAKYMAPDALALFGLDNLPVGTSINRLFINHETNEYGSRLIDDVFKDEFKAIILGRIPGRSMWAERKANEEPKSPMCQSYDGITGYANNTLNFNTTGFGSVPAQKDGQPVAITKRGTLDIDDHERVKLTCADCKLSDNGVDEDGIGVWRKPECADLSTLAILVDFFDKGTWEPAAIQFKSSALRPVHNYLAQLNELGQLPLMLETHFSLTQNQMDDDTVWSVPVLTRGEPTDPGTDNQNWEDYLKQWEALQETLTTPYLPNAPTGDDTAEMVDDEPAVPATGVDEDF